MAGIRRRYARDRMVENKPYKSGPGRIPGIKGYLPTGRATGQQQGMTDKDSASKKIIPLQYHDWVAKYALSAENEASGQGNRWLVFSCIGIRHTLYTRDDDDYRRCRKMLTVFAIPIEELVGGSFSGMVWLYLRSLLEERMGKTTISRQWGETGV